MTIIFNDSNFNVANSSNIEAGIIKSTGGDDNYFLNRAEKITGNADNLANVLEQAPVVGGLWAAEARFAGEVLALPDKARGAATNLAGNVLQTEGEIIEGGYKLVGNGFNVAGNLADNTSTLITDKADGIADKLENVPVLGGLWAAEARVAGEILALPSKIGGAIYHTAGNAYNAVGETIGGLYEKAGSLIKKL
jgi:hypothetical protein